MIAGSLACQSCNSTIAPGLTTCPNCGAPVTSPGTPVPARADWAADRKAWNALFQRLREVTGGEYEVLAELGQGGMAAVYVAWHNALQKHVALKVMSPTVMLSSGMIERFRTEAITQARLEHAHIATVHGVRQDADLHFIVMQYVPGRTLAQVLRHENTAGRKLSIPAVRSLLYQVGSALAHAHREGVIHRDVKPGNVLLRANGDAVVTDFGIAKVLSDPSITMTGTVVGTAPYMSPEQCYAAELTAASDQYSLGIVAYELLTGVQPFTGTSFKVMQAHVSETPPSIIEQRPDCPDDLEAAVMRMIAKQPASRFPDLTAALEALGAAPASPSPDDPVRRELVRVADVEGVRAELGDAFRGPPSPMPQGTSTPRPRTPTPVAPAPAVVGESPTAPTRIPDPDSGAAPSRPATAPVPRSRRALAVGAAGLIVVAAASAYLLTRNSDDPIAPPPPPPEIPRVAQVDFAPQVRTFRIGERMVLSAIARDSIGTPMDVPVQWELSSDDVGERRGDTVLFRGAGSLTITARAEQIATSAQVDVLDSARAVARVARVQIVASVTTLQVNDTVRFETQAFDTRNTLRTERPVQLRSSNTAVIDILPPGRVVGRRDGVATVQATVDGVTSEPVRFTVEAPAPPPPTSGTLRIGGDLPPGATLTLRGEGGQTRNLMERTVTLSPGSYVLEFRASGYAPDQQTVRVRAGETEMWTPEVRALPSPTPATTRDTAAEGAATLAAMRRFVDAFNARDANTVIPMLPADKRDAWRTLFQTQGLTGFTATLASSAPVSFATSDEATVPFAIRVRFRLMNQNQDQLLQLVGSHQRTSGAFRILSMQ